MEKGLGEASQEIGRWAEDVAWGIGAVVSVIISTILLPFRVVSALFSPEDARDN